MNIAVKTLTETIEKLLYEIERLENEIVVSNYMAEYYRKENETLKGAEKK